LIRFLQNPEIISLNTMKDLKSTGKTRISCINANHSTATGSIDINAVKKPQGLLIT